MSHCYTRSLLIGSWLYLLTQIRFLIGGEHVTCHWSKLNDALGRTKLHNSLGKQQLELSTHTWSGRAPLKPRQTCMPVQSAWCQQAIEVGQRFSLEKAFIIQEKEFISAKTDQINKEENFNILCLQAFNLTPKNGPPARCSIAVAR